MYEKIFAQAGLNEQEAVIYEIMLELGEARAKEIYQKSPFKRGLVYKILDNLIEKHLLTRIDKPNAVSTFRVEHPDKINDLMEAQERKVRHYKKSIQSLMPELISSYNLAFNKPGIKFYEGLSGMRKVYAEMLRDTQENENIISLVKVLDQKLDAETYAMLDDYDRKRIKKNIQLRMIAYGDKYAIQLKKDDAEKLTKTLLVASDKLALDFPGGEVLICKGKLYFMSLENNIHTAVVISSKGMTQLFTFFFESLWDKLVEAK
jgi:sugar-specific transcriptional regulator TrmB